jgi:hypothetical protein
MPQYKLHNKTTGKTWIESMSISECEAYLTANPDVERLVHGAPLIGHNTVNSKPDSGFRDVLKSIKKANKGSTINTW